MVVVVVVGVVLGLGVLGVGGVLVLGLECLSVFVFLGELLLCLLWMIILLLVVCSLIGGVVSLDFGVFGCLGVWVLFFFLVIMLLVLVFGVVLVLVL